MPGRVAGELLGVELTRRDDEVVDRLLGLEAEHDRRIPELQIEVEEQRPLASSNLAKAAARFVEVTVFPVPPLGENTVTMRPRRVDVDGGPQSRPSGLADGEDDVLGHLREEQDVGDVRVQRLLEQDRGLARGEQDDRRPRVLADRGDLVDGERRAPRPVEDLLEVPTGEDAGRLGHADARADELDLACRSRRRGAGRGRHTTR